MGFNVVQTMKDEDSVYVGRENKQGVATWMNPISFGEYRQLVADGHAPEKVFVERKTEVDGQKQTTYFQADMSSDGTEMKLRNADGDVYKFDSDGMLQRTQTASVNDSVERVDIKSRLQKGAPSVAVENGNRNGMGI